MTVAPNLASSMDLSSALPDMSSVSPGALLVMVGALVALAAGRTVVVLFRLVRLLVRSILQLFRALVILGLVVVLIVGWSLERVRDTDVRIEAPARPSIAAPGLVPSIGPLAPHK